ncbi:hypothetical protein BGLY_1177 [Bacillus glycinifermentans]|nr:hypothetical protein BGLY_1177 [Bacillus glycinifermentans]
MYVRPESTCCRVNAAGRMTDSGHVYHLRRKLLSQDRLFPVFLKKKMNSPFFT